MPEALVPLYALWLAILLDRFVGDPPNRLHPVAWMGQMIAWFQRRASTSRPAVALVAGIMLVLAGTTAAAACGLAVQRAGLELPLLANVLVQAVALKSMFSVRGLTQAGRAVQEALESGNLAEARRLVAHHLVSRDTSALTDSQVSAAAIESLAENSSDSIVAPLFYYCVAGLPGVFAYRFINTCDAMLGYRDGEREWLGKAAARTDDLVNLVPARISAALLIAAGTMLGSSPRASTAMWRRDCRRTSSPNAGHPMSAAAGVLGLQLEKAGLYQLGCGLRAPCPADIARALRLVVLATCLLLVSCSFLWYALHTWYNLAAKS